MGQQPSAPQRGNGNWSVADALELYNLPAWGSGYFSINEAGNVVVRPDGTPAHEIDLLEVVQGLQARDLAAPVVVRFSDILGAPPAPPERRLRARHRRVRVPQPLRGGVPDQGQSAAPGGR